MVPTDTMARGGPPDVSAVSAGDDRALLAQAVDAQVCANRSRALLLDALSRFHENRVEEVKASRGDEPAFFALTPLQSTKAEFGPLLGIGDQLIEANLGTADSLRRFFPRLWRQCLSGRVDLGRAAVPLGYLSRLTSDEDRGAYAKLVEEYLQQQDDPSAPLHPVRYTNLQQAAWRRSRRFEQKTREQSFSEAFAKRKVRLRVDEDGMATLACATSVDKGMQADYRLTLIAKKRAEADGESRTIEQLRVDTMLDLILGRVTVSASDADLEDGETAEGVEVGDPLQWHEVGKFARPIINVTVPITTLMGLSDAPGMLAGVRIPAELASMIALNPDSVWYRLLTDPAGRFLELSTKAYHPSDDVWRWTVAENPQCVWPTCRRPATVVDLDHRDSFPIGPTSTRNLQPLCERHHKVKHSKGFTVVREDDGSYTWTSRFGVVSRKPAPEYPVAEWPEGTIVRICGHHDEASGTSRAISVRLESVVERRFADLIAEAA